MSRFPKAQPLCLTLLLLFLVDVSFSQNLFLGKTDESCNLAMYGATEKQGFLEFDREFRDALKRRDAGAMALLIDHPLNVSGDRGSYQLTDPRSLQLRFDEIFPPIVRDAVLKAPPEDVACMEEGIMYGEHGEVWVHVLSDTRFGSRDKTRIRYALGTVNTPQLTARSKTKESELVFVCETSKHRIIIDTLDGQSHRYRAWNKPREVTEKPDLELSGGPGHGEGSGPCAYWVFAFENGKTSYVVADGMGCGDDPTAKDAIGSLEVRSGDKTEASFDCF